jgi:hypothetical protein
MNSSYRDGRDYYEGRGGRGYPLLPLMAAGQEGSGRFHRIGGAAELAATGDEDYGWDAASMTL